jgi:hypothetical protein
MHSPASSGPSLITKSTKVRKGTLILLGSMILLIVWGCFNDLSSSYADYQCNKSNAFASVRWASTSGTTKKSDLGMLFDSGRYRQLHWVPDISYEYSVKGKSYRSSQISFPNPTFLFWSDGRHYIDDYAVGDSVKVYYDPADPAKSCLINGVTHALTRRLLWRIDADPEVAKYASYMKRSNPFASDTDRETIDDAPMINQYTLE